MNLKFNDFLIEQKIKEYLCEDIGYIDLTSNLIENKKCSARLIAKSDGVVCGIQELEITFKLTNCNVITFKDDGDTVKIGDIVAQIEGDLLDILSTERIALNIIMKMSSISTSVRDLVDKLNSKNLTVKLASTRKTTPGFGIFEKKAVIIGGGDPHRWRLDDMVLIKDNHINSSSKSISEIIKKAKKLTSFSKKIEIEVNDENLGLEAALVGAEIIMFDNMSPERIKNAISNIKTKLKEKNYQIPLFEASGNITHENFMKYAESGVDIISTSEITLHPHKKMDFSLEINLN